MSDGDPNRKERWALAELIAKVIKAGLPTASDVEACLSDIVITHGGRRWILNLNEFPEEL